MGLINQVLTVSPNIIKLLLTPLNYPIRHLIFRKNRRKMQRLYSKVVRKGDLVFDVGANTGFHTQVFLDLGARVIAIEPQPWCTKLLKNKFFGLETVIIVEAGLASHSGVLVLHTNKIIPQISTFSEFFRNNNKLLGIWGRPLEVTVTTIDDLVKRYGTPDFIKIDVEGYELEVIKGMTSIRPRLSFEFHKTTLDETRRCIWQVVQHQPVAMNYSCYDNYRFMSTVWMSESECLKQLNSIKQKDLYGDIFINFVVPDPTGQLPI